ncbi:MAG: hypothetical protein U0939_25355 [Pirellulales bacterium]
MSTELLKIVESLVVPAAEASARTMRIHAEVLGRSKYLDGPNFTVVHPFDLELLFAAYDREFFAGRLRAALGDAPLQFSLSRRLTSAGGTTTRRVERRTGRVKYEIKASAAVLYSCFHEDDHREVAVAGIVCRDRLDALQRIMEHELVHLIEMILWQDSSCARARFQSITGRIFNHTEHRHKLITPRERTMMATGIRPGMHVRFDFEGRELVGVVNRINRRVTVLVEDPRGRPYTDGKRYVKFYVPTKILKRV